MEKKTVSRNEKEKSVKTTGREIHPIPKDKVGEIIDEFMKDELDPKTVSVEDMNLPTRIFLSLWRNHTRTLDQLLRMSPSEIIKIRNIGLKSYEEIKSKVEEYGYIYPNMSTPAIVVMDDGIEYINKKMEVDSSMAAFLDNLKAPNAIAKKISDLEEENEDLKKKNSELERKYKDDLNRIYSARALTAEDCNIGYLINVILRKMDENHQPFLVTIIGDMIIDIHSKEFEPKKPVRDYGSYVALEQRRVLHNGMDQN